MQVGVSNPSPGSAQSNGMSSSSRVMLIKGAEYRDLAIDSENGHTLGSARVNFPPHYSLSKATLNIS